MKVEITTREEMGAFGLSEEHRNDRFNFAVRETDARREREAMANRRRERAVASQTNVNPPERK